MNDLAPSRPDLAATLPVAPGIERAPRSLFVILCTIWATIMLIEHISNNLLPLTIRRFTLDAAIIGLILGINPFFGLFVQPLIGLLSDRIWTPLGRRAVFLVAAAPVLAVCLVFVPLAGSFWQLVVLIVVYQFCHDVLCGADHPLMADLVPAHQRTLLRGWMTMSAQFIGFIFLKFGMGHALERFGEVSIYVAVAIATVGFIALPALLLREKRLPPVPRPRLTMKRYITDFFGNSVLRRFGLLVFTHAVFVNVVTGFVVIFAVQTVGISKGEFGSAWSLQSLVALACAVPLGIVAERVPKQRALVAGFVICMGGCILGILAEDARDFIPIALVFGLGALIIQITQAPFFTEFLPRDMVGQLTGAYNICGATGRSIALVGGGWLVSALGNNYRVIWAIALVFGVLSAVIAASIVDLRYVQRRNPSPTAPI